MSKFNQTMRSNVNYAGIMSGIRTNINLLGANKTFAETEGHNSFVVNASAQGFAFGEDDRPERIIRSFFTAVSLFLKVQKVAKEDEAVALVLTDTEGSFRFAAYMCYNPNQDNPKEPGSWTYEMTLREEVFEELEKERKVKKLLVGDSAFYSIFCKAAYDVGGVEFESDHFMYDASMLVIDTIYQVLDGEAVPGETVEVEFPGYFKAIVSVEDGEKVFGLEPLGQMKAIAKGDADLESVVE